MSLDSTLRHRAAGILLAVLALMAAGSFVPATAGAEEPAASHSGTASSAFSQVQDVPATFIGFVYPDAQGHLASRVRALGADGVVCGTATVLALRNDLGFYQLNVVSLLTRQGCPDTGMPVTFVLLYGNVGDGQPAVADRPAPFLPGLTSVASLTPAREAGSGWAGTLTSGSGAESTLVWRGADGTPVADALARLDAPVARALRFSASSGSWSIYVPGGPAFLQTFQTLDHGDVVRVRLR